MLETKWTLNRRKKKAAQEKGMHFLTVHFETAWRNNFPDKKLTRSAISISTENPRASQNEISLRQPPFASPGHLSEREGEKQKGGNGK